MAAHFQTPLNASRARRLLCRIDGARPWQLSMMRTQHAHSRMQRPQCEALTALLSPKVLVRFLARHTGDFQMSGG